MKVLIITQHYLDEQLGGPNCSKAFIKALANIFDDCTLIFPEHNDCETDLYFLNETNIRLLPCHDHRSKLRKVVDIYFGKLRRFGRFAKAELKRNRYDIVFFDHSVIASSGVIQAAKKYAGRIVTLHHNVEKEYLRDNPQNILINLPYNYFALKAEKDALLTSDLNMTLTDDDARKFAEEYPAKKDSFRTIGMFLYDDAKNEALSTEEGNVFVISGSLAAMQTELAMISFLNDYLPVLNKVCPDNKLIITGRNPSQRLQEICNKNKNIELIASPQDIFAEIRKANYYIAPINTGGGLKLRIMDGLRFGLPVVAHKMATRGYEPIVKDGCMTGYDSPETFERALRELLGKNLTHVRVRESFLRHFSFEAGKKRLCEILKESQQ